MQKRTRRTILLLFTLIFAIAGTIVVLYAQGWRMDWGDFDITKVGALYVKSEPTNTQITLDGKPVQKRRSFLGGGVFMHNLLPGTHQLRVEAPLHKPIEATVTISPSLITHLAQLVLVPTKSRSIIPTDVENFWVNNFGLIVQNTQGELLQNGNSIDGDRVVASQPSYFLVENTSKNHYLLLHEEEVIDLTRTLAAEGIPLYPSAANVVSASRQGFVASTRNGTYLVRTGNLSFSRLSETPAAKAAYSSPWVAWTIEENPKTIYVFNLFTQQSSPSTYQLDSPVRKINAAKDTIITLEESGGLSLITPGSDTFRPLANEVLNFDISSDRQKIAAVGENALEIFSFPDAEDRWRFNINNTNSIKKLGWYKDSHHLFLHYPKHISFLDLSDIHLEYVVDIASTPYGQYSEGNNTMYWVDGSTLRGKEFPE